MPAIQLRAMAQVVLAVESAAMDEMVPKLAGAANFERQVVDMFRNDWRLIGRAKPLASVAGIAIVEEPLKNGISIESFYFFGNCLSVAGCAL